MTVPHNALRCFPSRPISRIPSWTVISLGRKLPSASSGAPGDGAGHAIVPIHRLAPGRACLVSPACADRHCGAGPRLAADGCYPLPCPVESGLSSTAFAAATVWPARIFILTVPCRAEKRVHPLRGTKERVVFGSAALRDVVLDHRIRIAGSTTLTQVRREMHGVKERAAEMRHRPPRDDDAALRAARAVAGEVAVHQPDRPRRELARGLLGAGVSSLLAYVIDRRTDRHSEGAQRGPIGGDGAFDRDLDPDDLDGIRFTCARRVSQVLDQKPRAKRNVGWRNPA